MKKIFIYFLSLVLMIPIFVKAGGTLTVDKSPLTISEGGSGTFKITANNVSGDITIESSDPTIATANKSYFWIEQCNDEDHCSDGASEKVITVNGLKAGTATINVHVNVASFDDEEEIIRDDTISVTVTHELSKNANLNDIKIDNVSLSGFSSNATEYDIPIEKESISIAAVVEDEHATVTGIGLYDLSYGLNKIQLVVTAEDGRTKKTYTLNITRTDYRDSNNYLQSLEIDAGTLVFDKNKLNYEVEVDPSVENVNITAEAESSKATVTGDGNQQLTGDSTTLSIVVTAENGSKKTYKIVVTKTDSRESNNYLKSLTVSEGKLTFNKNTLEYIVRVKENVTSIKITAEAESSKATVTGDGTKTLSEETNVFNIVVTAENESTKTYEVTVIRTNDVLLTYNSNKGSICSPTYKSATPGEEWGELCTPNRQGYRFDGWYTESSGGDQVTASTIATVDITVYAHWVTNVVNPSTGLKTPIAILVCLIVASVVVLIVIRKRNMAF